MPRVRRRPKSRREGIEDKHVQYLLTGFWYVRPFPFADDEAEQREVWNELRDELLPDWIAESPGTRPWAWWQFDAPERRRRINGAHPFDNPERSASQNRLWFGRPAVYVCRDDSEARYETEREYLTRLNLLLPEEMDSTAPPKEWEWDWSK